MSKLISILLSTNNSFKNNHISNILSIIKSARFLSGNNIKTGKYEKNEVNEFIFENDLYHPFQFVGLMNYLIFLELIGSVLKPKNNSTKEDNGIKRALILFSELNTKEIAICYNLRNSIVHRFSLATENKPQSFKFVLSIENNDQLFKEAKTEWNGDFSDTSENTDTTIYVRNFIDFVENIYTNLVKMNKNNELEINHNIDINEVYKRYTIKI